MKEFLRKIINPSLWDFIRYIKFKFFKFGHFAPYQLDKKLKKYLNYDYGFFVELGANDGYTESNTLFLENKRNWRGVLIEPSPHQFLNCCYYRSKPGNKLFCNACVPFNYKREYVDIEYANLMSISVSLKNDLKNIDNHLISGRNHIMNSARSIRFGSIAKTLTKILDESRAPKIIDFMSIDVEGAEFSVIRGIDFNKYQFKYILVECRKPSNITNYLNKHNYKKISKLTHHDYLFKYMK